MNDSRQPEVIGKDGLSGILIDPLPADPQADETVRMRLRDGRVVSVPAASMVAGSGGTYLIPFGMQDLIEGEQPVQRTANEGVIPVLAEELVIDRKRVPTGGVRVTRKILEHDETIELPLMRERVDVRRIVVDREVDGPQAIRREGDITIIPVVEEEVVVQKRYRLKEEIHVSKQVREEMHRERVTLQRQEPEIEHLDAEGRTITPVSARKREPATAPAPATPPAPARRKRRSILGED